MAETAKSHASVKFEPQGHGRCWSGSHTVHAASMDAVASALRLRHALHAEFLLLPDFFGISSPRYFAIFCDILRYFAILRNTMQYCDIVSAPSTQHGLVAPRGLAALNGSLFIAEGTHVLGVGVGSDGGAGGRVRRAEATAMRRNACSHVGLPEPSDRRTPDRAAARKPMGAGVLRGLLWPV